MLFTVYALTLHANLIGAPFNGLLAERVEHHLTGKSPNDAPSWLFLLKTIPKTIWSEIRKLLYLAGWMLLLLIAGFTGNAAIDNISVTGDPTPVEEALSSIWLTIATTTTMVASRFGDQSYSF